MAGMTLTNVIMLSCNITFLCPKGYQYTDEIVQIESKALNGLILPCQLEELSLNDNKLSLIESGVIQVIAEMQ